MNRVKYFHAVSGRVVIARYNPSRKYDADHWGRSLVPSLAHLDREMYRRGFQRAGIRRAPGTIVKLFRKAFEALRWGKK